MPIILGVVLAIVIIALLIIVIYWFTRRKKLKDELKDVEDEVVLPPKIKYALEQNPKTNSPPPELSSSSESDRPKKKVFEAPVPHDSDDDKNPLPYDIED